MGANQQRQRGVGFMEAARVPRCHERLSIPCENAALHRQPSDLRLIRRDEGTSTRCRRVELLLREFHVMPPLCSGAAATGLVYVLPQGKKTRSRERDNGSWRYVFILIGLPTPGA